MNECKVREEYCHLTKTLIERGLLITTMESCTSGQIASLITDTEGSSAIMKGAFITYSNEAKVQCGVPAETIETYGVYSKETAVAMAQACRRAFGADIGVGITGTMGNVDPVNHDSIPGEVYYAIDILGEIHCETIAIPPLGSRYEYKLTAAEHVVITLLSLIDSRRIIE